jgi:hypothetical protein
LMFTSQSRLCWFERPCRLASALASPLTAEPASPEGERGVPPKKFSAGTWVNAILAINALSCRETT